MILFKKCAVAFSFCFLTITVIWKRLVAITHNDGGMVSCGLRSDNLSTEYKF